MTFDYTKYAKMIKDKIDYYGGSANYYQNIDGTIDSVTGIATYNQIVIPIKVLITDYSQLVIDNTIVKTGDKQVIMESSIGTPKLNDNIEISGTKYKIISVSEVIPNASDILLYKLQTRSYSLAGSAIDVLSVKLGTLEEGTLIVDPIGVVDGIVWRIIAHNHHGTDITTLVSDEIWAWAAFDGSDGLVGYYPNTPWRVSWMWYYLNGQFLTDYISAEFQELMQSVALETQTITYLEKIALLSKEEVFDIESISSSGSYIDYFSNSAYRIARWKEDQEAMSWWLRDVYEEDPPNGIIEAVGSTGNTYLRYDNWTLGVRPIIFLSSAQKVQIAPDGLTFAIEYN